jgi:hypothetical protein
LNVYLEGKENEWRWTFIREWTVECGIDIFIRLISECHANQCAGTLIKDIKIRKFKITLFTFSKN